MQDRRTLATPNSRRGLLGWGVLVTALGGFLFGYDTAVINGAIRYLQSHFQLDATKEGLAGAAAVLGCIPGAMFAGMFSDRLGRRRALTVCALLYAASGVLSAIPQTFAQFLAARLLSGLAIGASSMICPVYVAELAPAQRRGQLGSLFQFGIVIGIFVTLLVNACIQRVGDQRWNVEVGWRWMLVAEIVPAIALLFALPYAPESPRWQVLVGREEDATRTFVALVGEASAGAEIAAIRQSMRQDEGRFGELLTGAARRPFIISIVLMAVSQLSGINAILYYSTRIFADAGVGVTNAFAASVIIGLVNLVFTLVALMFVDRAGRRPLLMIGLATQVVALSTVAWMFQAGINDSRLLVAILVFIAAFALALGPIPWILCAEIFPTRIRGRAMSVATFTIWLACYVVAQTFPMLNDSPRIGPVATFAIYATFSLLGLVFVVFAVPETKGKTLEEIEHTWSSVPSR